MSRTIKNNKIEKYHKPSIYGGGCVSGADKAWQRWKRRRKVKLQRSRNKKLIEYELNELNYV